MPNFHGSATARVPARPDEVFDLITDIDRLPDWNACIEKIVQRPASLAIGSEWLVTMHVPGMPRWDSRSRIVELDRDAGRFVHRTQTDDGNPSVGIWTWEVSSVDDGTDLTVSWDVQPKTFWRRVLFSRIRHRQLDKEVPTSLHAAADLVAAAG